jgi:hypothetical protein
VAARTIARRVILIAPMALQRLWIYGPCAHMSLKGGISVSALPKPAAARYECLLTVWPSGSSTRFWPMVSAPGGACCDLPTLCELHRAGLGGATALADRNRGSIAFQRLTYAFGQNRKKMAAESTGPPAPSIVITKGHNCSDSDSSINNLTLFALRRNALRRNRLPRSSVVR